MLTKNITIHRPPHIYLDENIYFITAHTFYKKPLFNTEEKLRSFASLLQKAVNRYYIDLYAWVLLENHYHLLLKISKGNDLVKFIRKLHSDTAIYLNRVDKVSRRRVWYQYWDKCIRNETDFWKHFNYIHHNPVKHGNIKNQDLVKNYKFCSYRQWLKRKGKKWLISCFELYSIIDFTVPE
ncbi:transposase [bacterium]|nr:transposase [bacterium]